MNLMSAPMYCTCERSIACSAPITRVGSPGAPGWTMGGRASTAVTPAVRHAANETSAGSRATTRIRSMCAHRTRAADRRSGFARKEFMRFAPRAFIEWMVSTVTQARNSRANGTSFASTMFMHLRVIAGAAFLTVVCACGPTMPPTSAPKPADPTFDPLRTVLQQYIDQTQPYRKQAAQAQESTPGKATPTTAAATAVRTRQNDLGDALRTKLRPNARQGELFTPDITDAFRHRIAAAFDSPKRDLLLDDMAEQLTTPAPTQTARINQRLEAPRIPPRLMELLSPMSANTVPPRSCGIGSGDVAPPTIGCGGTVGTLAVAFTGNASGR